MVVSDTYRRLVEIVYVLVKKIIDGITHNDAVIWLYCGLAVYKKGRARELSVDK